MTKYSIVVPVFNGEEYIQNCINSILEQQSGNYTYEIIIVDDCSIDNTFEILQDFRQSNVKVFQTSKNSGPGTARNIGINNSLGDWILFLDSDDRLRDNALYNLTKFIETNNDIDVVTYNWDYDISSNINSARSGRYDFESFKSTKKELIDDYLSWGMDGSVIYTLISSEILKNNIILFRDGYHEDVDFIFKIYYFAKKIGILDEIIYFKNNREGSIVNKISEKHIDGFFSAFEEIHSFLKKENYLDDNILRNLYVGIVGVTTTRLKEIWTNGDNCNQMYLYGYLFQKVQNYIEQYLLQTIFPNLQTRYFIIYRFFIDLLQNKHKKNIVYEIDKFLSDTFKKNWSCYDLHNSLFLAPDEIRTCCKRFFDDGKIKGDVVLVKDEINIKNIINAKQKLFSDINKGKSEECMNCPFLEFKEWNRIEKLEIEHLSLEYHSVCNMRCIYCSDKYYGDQQPSYDINELIDQLIENQSLNSCKSIVWGGGEPTLDKKFVRILDKIISNIDFIKPRIITNSTVFVKQLYKYICNDQVVITTSIDAGTQETFHQIRHSTKFVQVFKNLQLYSSKYPNNVTIKYILMDNNIDIEELNGFVGLIQEYGLEQCTFQISFDFKKEIVEREYIVAAILFYGLLKKINAKTIFFDDLFLQRLNISSKNQLMKVYEDLKFLECEDFLFNYEQNKEIIIWGAGNGTKDILQNSYILKIVKVLYIVDNSKSKIGTKFLGYDIKDPEELNNNNLPIYISAFEKFPIILNEFSKLKLDKKRLIKGLLL